jgi:EAL domain-containing protein (putative c-di-GMP-specific phosphodiesterase class I)/DNA-binding NarL/FixJ family response regulator
MIHDAPRRAPTVIVADDEPHVVEYLQQVLEMEGFVVVGTATDADGAVQLVHRLEPDVALLDLRMPGGGLEAARLSGSLSPATRIVIFSAAADESDLLPLLRSGIDGYVVKGSPPERLIEAIHAAVAGESYLAPAVSRFAMTQLSNRLLAEEQDALVAMRLRKRIGAAISDAAFEIAFQPIIDVHLDVAVAAEALVRFPGQSRPPRTWLDDADRVGLLVPLELALAAAALSELHRLDLPIAMAINVSPKTVLSGRLHEVFTGVPLERVILELTEHARVTDYAGLRTALSRWRERGLRLAVDDAGCGYASLTHIVELRPELIKLDASLVRDLHTSQHRQALTRAVIGFADEMGVQVVAEGVETEAELVELRRLGAHLAQGYHLGRPRPLDLQAELAATLDLRDPPTPARHEFRLHAVSDRDRQRRRY